MPFAAVSIVRTRLVRVNTVRIIEALLGVGRDTCGAPAADVARVIVRADRCGCICVADDGPASVSPAGFTGLTGAVIELVAASADVRFIKEAL